PVTIARARGQQGARIQILYHASQRLLRDAEETEEVGNRKAGLARDEIERAVMRAPQFLLGEPRIDRPPERTMRKKQIFDAPAYFFFAQEKGRGSGNL